MIKKFLVFITIFTFCTLQSSADKHVFNFSTDAGDDAENHWTLTLDLNKDAGTMKLSLDKIIYDVSSLIPKPKARVIYYDNVPLSYFMPIGYFLNFSYGGNTDELVFISDKEIIIFGIYIDPEEIGNDKHHHGYIILPNSEGELKTHKTHLIKHSYYRDYAILLNASKETIAKINNEKTKQQPTPAPKKAQTTAISKTTPSSQKRTQATANTSRTTAQKSTQSNRANSTSQKPKQTVKKKEVIYYGSTTVSVLKNYNFELKDAICKVFGKIDPTLLIDKDWNQIALILKKTFGIEPLCNSNFYFYDYYCRNCKLLGVNLSQLCIRSDHDSYFNWEYKFEFKKKKDAKNFYRRLQAHVGSLGYKSQDPYKDIHETWYTRDICGNKEVYISVFNTKVERGLYVVSLETSIHLK